jgi:radical SAM superfamily enzyme YgiQ (UPF0313 family)
MVDVLLIQSPIRDFYLTAKRTIPYGLACLAAVLIEDGFSVRIVDALATSKSRIIDLPEEMAYVHKYYGKSDQSPFALFHHFRHFGYSFEHIGKLARESHAFLVGISSLFTSYMAETIETAEIVKAYLPECRIVVGGHHPTAHPESVMESAAVDFVLRGEGEVSIGRLADAVKSGGGYDNISGLVYRRSNGELRINNPAIMRHPDQYPLPATHLIHHKFYKRKRRGSAVIVASRGCPMKCTYCSVGAWSYLPFRRRSIESVMREIAAAIETHEVGFIDFEDENLSLDRKWFITLLQDIAARFGKHRLELRAMNGLYPPSLNEEVIKSMKAAGFKTLNLALASISKKQLKRFQRSDVRVAFDRALNLSNTHGLNAVGYIIIGAPHQKALDSLSDMFFLAERRVLAGVSVFYPAPGSPDYDLCTELDLLPAYFSCMRSSTLPLSHTTTRLETVTLLRLGRILNFMKSLLDAGLSIPKPLPAGADIANLRERNDIGKKLLRYFLYDGKIRGMSRNGKIFEHYIDIPLVQQFLEGLKSVHIQGAGNEETI